MRACVRAYVCACVCMNDVENDIYKVHNFADDTKVFRKAKDDGDNNIHR